HSYFLLWPSLFREARLHLRRISSSLSEFHSLGGRTLLARPFHLQRRRPLARRYSRRWIHERRLRIPLLAFRRVLELSPCGVREHRYGLDSQGPAREKISSCRKTPLSSQRRGHSPIFPTSAGPVPPSRSGPCREASHSLGWHTWLCPRTRQSPACCQTPRVPSEHPFPVCRRRFCSGRFATTPTETPALQRYLPRSRSSRPGPRLFLYLTLRPRLPRRYPHLRGRAPFEAVPHPRFGQAA